jgi:hypothetical protein
MRPLEKLVIAPGATSAGPPARLEWLALDSLFIDQAYQREVGREGERHVRAIAARFEWCKFAPVIVTPINGSLPRYAIIDGQHRSMAALALGFDRVPCAIVQARVKQAADIFAAVNGQVRRISATQVYKAALAAGADWAVTVRDISNAHGIDVLTYPVSAVNQKPWQTNAVIRFKRILDRNGPDFLRACLMLVKAQPHGHVPGFVTSHVLDDMKTRLLSHTMNSRKATPQEIATAIIAASTRQAVPVAAEPAALVRVEVPGFAKETDDTARRIAELKRRGFIRSMVAASLRLRHDVVNRHWEAKA